MASRGKKTPDRKIIGRLMRFATGAAWSSFFAQPAMAKPMARKIRSASPTMIASTSYEPNICRPNQMPMPMRMATWT